MNSKHKTQDIAPSAALSQEEVEANNRMAIGVLIPLLITFILGTLCLQGFNLVFQQIGKDVGAPQQAPLITSFPIIVLGIVCFIYGSLGDFVSLKKLVYFGLGMLVVGSVLGFLLNYYFTPNLWTVIVARVLQTAGEQVAGSAYLVVTTKYLKPSLRALFFGIFSAGYQVSAAVGVFAAGILSAISWQFLFLVPAVTILLLPFLRNLPDHNGTGSKVDTVGFLIFGFATAFLTLFFSYKLWWLLLVAIGLFLVFGIYIHQARNPFITPAFFKNTRWILAILLIAVFYFVNYCAGPLVNAIARDVYHLETHEVSNYLAWSFIIAAVTATLAGAIVRKIGRTPVIIFSASLMALSFILPAFFVDKGMGWVYIMSFMFYGGTGLMYAPVVSTVIDTLPTSESGRGVGLNDLIMNVTASIGIATFGGSLFGGAGESTSITGLTGAAATFSNIMLICGAIFVAGLVYYLVVYRYIARTPRVAE